MGLARTWTVSGIVWGMTFLSVVAEAAPPVRCELRLGAWCITEGAYEIHRRLAEDAVNDRAWTLRGAFRPESALVILEPNGCSQGQSDVQLLSDFQHGYAWRGRNWDRALLRLKSDGSCDLAVLFPADSRDPLAWAFPEGFSRIRPCHDDMCSTGHLTAIMSFIAEKRRSGN